MQGVIAAGDPETARAGASILQAGGNAVDAAVAAAFVSFISEVGVVHLGGSGIAQIFKPSENGTDHSCITYDFFSNMPGLGMGQIGGPIDFEKVIIDFGPTTQEFYLGRGSVAVPGNIFGLCQMARDHGRLPLPALLEPATRLAENGHGLAEFQAETCALLEPIYTHTSDMREIFSRKGRIIKTGERLYIPHLGQTLRALAEEGEELLRSGHLAHAIVKDQHENGGLLTTDDLNAYEVSSIEPIRFSYREYEILLPPPSSSGGVLTAFTLKLLSSFDVSSFSYGSVEHLQLLFEVMAATTRARPFWDRAADELPVKEAISYFLGDQFVNHYVEEVAAGLSGRSQLPILSEPTPHPDTSHLSVIDSDGLAVSLTTTAGESAGYVVPATGFIPNNILGEADLHPSGFHNRPAGQRINTMMTPTIVLLNGKIRLVVGSGGSIRIRSAILQVLSNLLDFKMRLVDAVNDPRVHLEHGILQCELGVDPGAIRQLEEMDYPVNRWDRKSIYFGGAHSVSRTVTGKIVGAGDDRRGGSVAIVNG